MRVKCVDEVSCHCRITHHRPPVVDEDPQLKRIKIPSNIYMPSRGPLSRADHNSSGTNSDDDTQPPTPQHLLSPIGYSALALHSSKSSDDSEMSHAMAALMDSPSHIPLIHPTTYQLSSSTYLPSPPASLRIQLPDGVPDPFLRMPKPKSAMPRHVSYQPLTPEDQRALRSFDLRL